MTHFLSFRSACLATLLPALLLTAACARDGRDDALAMRALQARQQVLVAEQVACARDSTTLLPGLLAESRCYVHPVPENPADPSGRQVSLRVMVLPAIRTLPEPDPFVILVGGPGQAATIDALPLVPAFQRIRQDRDILLVDQRGTGPLSPFTCTFGDDEDSLQGSAELLLDLQLRYLRECLAGLDAAPEYYTTDIAAGDLENIRDWLGYRELNLWGVSYGTRVALTYLSLYPERTRTVVLDGVAPPGILPLEAALDGGRALERAFGLCAAESSCAGAFPTLRATFENLMTRHAQPRQVSLVAPRDGTTREFELTAPLIEGLLFQMLYSRETTRLIPLFIAELARDNLQVLTWTEGSAAGINIPMHYSVICSEDLPLLDRNALAGSEGETPFAHELLVRPRIEGCGIWPARELPATFFAPVTADRPVLIFSATQDPVTPPRWGDRVAASLPNVRHLVADGIGHGVFAYGCAARLVGEFVDSARLDVLDAACLDTLAPRPFFTTWNGSGDADD